MQIHLMQFILCTYEGDGWKAGNPVGEIIKNHEEELQIQFKKPQAERRTGYCALTSCHLDIIFPSISFCGKRRALVVFSAIECTPGVSTLE